MWLTLKYKTKSKKVTERRKERLYNHSKVHITSLIDSRVSLLIIDLTKHAKDGNGTIKLCVESDFAFALVLLYNAPVIG